jgi:elongation factor Ts
MATITAADVKRLREITGAGMLDCKKALEETGGDLDRAVEVLRIKYQAKVDTKAAERTASNGLVAASGGALVEIQTETDFVAKNADVQALAAAVADTVDALASGDRDAVLAATLGTGSTVEQAVRDVAAKIGEKIELGRVAYLAGPVAVYLHRRSSDLPPQVGVLVAFDGDDVDAARAAAMQVAAMRPKYVTRDEVPADVVAHEREIAEATSREEGKPAAALPKIVEGRLNGFFKEVVLLEQASVQDSKRTVKAVLDGAGVAVTGFARIEVGQA